MIEHIGFADVWLDNPRIRIEIRIGNAVYTYGCDVCTEEELCDFTRMRVAELLHCGQFDHQITDIVPRIDAAGYHCELVYNWDKFTYEVNHDSQTS